METETATEAEAATEAGTEAGAVIETDAVAVSEAGSEAGSDTGNVAVATPEPTLVERVGLLPLVALAAAGFAGLVHYALSPEASYPWLRPLEILKGIYSGPTTPTLMALAMGLGLLAKAGSVRGAGGAMRGALEAGTARATTLRALGVGVLVALVDRLLFPFHAPLDSVAVVTLGAALYVSARAHGRDGPLRGGIELATTLGTFVLVSYAFTIIKAHLFMLHAPSDATLVAAERTLFGRPLHVVVAEWARQNPLAVLWADEVYDRMFQHMLVVSAFLSGLGRGDVRRRYIVALCLAYLIGSVAYHVIPSVGPVYADPDRFAYLRQLPLRTNMYQAFLARSTDAVSRGHVGSLETYAYVAAMPSLHLAHESVMLVYARFSRPFFALSLVFYLGTMVAVLILGWHYALDIVGGIALAALSVWLAERGGERWFGLRTRSAA